MPVLEFFFLFLGKWPKYKRRGWIVIDLFFDLTDRFPAFSLKAIVGPNAGSPSLDDARQSKSR